MEYIARETRAFESVPSTADGGRQEANRNCKGTVYWGILCRTCRDLVAFDASPYASFGSEAASMHPGAIRCSHGHSHIYFPRDFAFYPSAVVIAEAAMQLNRETFRAV